MKIRAFALRNVKELLRDRLNLLFGICFPLLLLIMLTTISRAAPDAPFTIQTLAPGIAVFGFSFLSLFSGLLISKDRTSSFMLRLFTSPLTARDFILGYTLPLLPMAATQAAVCLLSALLLGLDRSSHLLATLVTLLPSMVLFIALGLICGTVFTDKQVGGVCGALLTNLCTFLSGCWFDPALVGGPFLAIAKALPFYHAVNSARAALAGDWGGIFPALWWVIGYASALMILAVVLFLRRMNAQD